jgi:tetratricopeptide (TPR) repeat protein
MGRASVVVLLLLGLASAGHAEDRVKAREAYRSATSHYDLREFKEALVDFKDAYRQYPDPTFLYNIAQCDRQIGDNAEAIRFFRTFLNKVPNTPNRAEVTEIIARLQREEAAKAAAPPTPTPTPTPTPEPAVPAPVAPPPVVTSPPPAAVVLTEAPPARVDHKRKWVIPVAVVGAVVVVGVAVGLGVGLSLSHAPTASTDGGTIKPSWQ